MKKYKLEIEVHLPHSPKLRLSYIISSSSFLNAHQKAVLNVYQELGELFPTTLISSQEYELS